MKAFLFSFLVAFPHLAAAKVTETFPVAGTKFEFTVNQKLICDIADDTESSSGKSHRAQALCTTIVISAEELEAASLSSPEVRIAQNEAFNRPSAFRIKLEQLSAKFHVNVRSESTPIFEASLGLPRTKPGFGKYLGAGLQLQIFCGQESASKPHCTKREMANLVSLFLVELESKPITGFIPVKGPGETFEEPCVSYGATTCP